MLVVYVNGLLEPSIMQQYHTRYGGDFKAIAQRDSQFFDKPRRGTTAFALECFHSDQIFKIREAHEAEGIPEVSLNMPVERVEIEPPAEPKPTRRKRRTKAEIEADNADTDNDTGRE